MLSKFAAKICTSVITELGEKGEEYSDKQKASLVFMVDNKDYHFLRANIQLDMENLKYVIHITFHCQSYGYKYIGICQE